MNTKIAILTSGHNPFDERLFYKLAQSLKNNDFDTAIFTSTQNINESKHEIILKGFASENLNKRGKINKFRDLLIEFKPDVVICAEILPILAAYKYKKELNKICKIIYDLTEWYPESYKSKLPAPVYYALYPLLYFFQYYSIQKVDGIIYGEERKIKRFNFIAPTKKKILISYYPLLKYFDYSCPPFDEKELTVCFTGLLKEDRGISRFINIAEKISDAYPDINLKVKLIGRFTKPELKDKILKKIMLKENCRLEVVDWLPYYEISNSLKDVDICFDLRENNFIYNNSLPIKLFEYMACGKPVVYSDIPAIKDLLQDDEIGYFVNPNDEIEIIEKVGRYINDKTTLERHSQKGRELVEQFYNWEMIEKNLINFIKEI